MSTEDKHRYNEYFSRLEVDDEDGSDYTDHWNSGELLCLASAVQRSGDKNWVSVSRAIKPYGEAKRPSDWYASKNCALQYSKLLKGVEDLKKKSLPRTERETSEELLVKNLTDKRLNELKYQNQLVLNTANILQSQLEMLENGEFDDNLDEMMKQIEEQDRNDKEEYKEWLAKRESLNQVKRLNKCRAPISKGKAPTSRSLESRRKNSPNPDHSDHDTLHSIAAEANIKIEVDSGEESPQLPKLKIKTEPEQFLLTKANMEDFRMHSPQVSIPASHPIPPTSPLLTSLLRNVASATPMSSSNNSSPLKEITAEDLLQSAKLLNSDIISSRKSDPSQQIFLSPTQTSTSSISPLLTSLLKSPTAATPVSPISTNVITPSLPKEIEQFEALEPLKIPINASEAEGASIPKIKDMTIHGHMSSHPVPATSPLLNSLLKSPNSSIPVASAASTSLSPMQILQPKEATTAKSASPPQSFFNPTSALATAAAQQLAAVTANLPPNHHFFQPPDATGRKSVHSSPINSATLSAPTLSKLLEMPPSTPGKLPPLPVIDSPSTVAAAVLLAAESLQVEANIQTSTLFQTPPRNTSIPVQPDFVSGLPKGMEDHKLDDAKAVDLLDAESAAILESNLDIDFTKAIGKDALDSFSFDDLEFEDAENILKALSNSTVKETVDAELEKTKIQSAGLLPCPNLENKFEKISQPIVEVVAVSKSAEIEDETGANSKKFYKSRSTPKKRTSVEDDVIDKVIETPTLTSPILSSKRTIRASKQFDFDNDQLLSTESTGPPSSDQEEIKESKDVKIEILSPVSSKKPRLYEKKPTKECNEEEAPYVRRPGPGRPKKFRGKVLKPAATKVEDEKDQYEFSENTEDSSVSYQTANTLCYMPRIKEESHTEEAKVKPQDNENAGSSKSSSKSDKKFFSVSQKTKQGTSDDNTPGKKALFTSDEEHLSDSLDVSDDVSKSQLPEEKIKNWRAMTEKQTEGSDNITKAKLRKSVVAESSKKQGKKTSTKSDKNRPAKKAKKQVKDASESDFDELPGFTQETEDSSVLSAGETAWQKQAPTDTVSTAQEKVKSEILSDMEVETNDSHVSSSIAAESDRQTDDMEGYESHQGSVTTDFSTPPLSAKDEKDRSRFGKQEWFQGSSPKGSEPQSSEDSEEYESDNSDNQSVSTNKSTSQSTETSRMKQKEKETPEYKAWKKSISIVWREASCHKFANVFSQKVTNDVAPGYLGIVNRPMDLSLIKKNIDGGGIRTTYEFMRDMMLMFQNAIMYNSSDHDVYQMAREMRGDVKNQLLDFYATQVKIKEKSGEQTTSSLRAARNAKTNKTPQSLTKSREEAD